MADFTGTPGDDILTGAATDDTLSGLAGNDRLIGGAGADLLDGGDGFDLADYADSLAAVTVDLGGGLASGGDAQGDTLISIEDVTGSRFDDVLTGDAGDNQLTGGNGVDRISGGDGDDRINGGAGADILTAAGGSDWLIYRGSAVGVTVDLGSGLASGGHAEGDTFRGFENLIGSNHDDVLTGTQDANTLRGRDGADSLFGGLGDDVLIGGRGGDLVDGGAGFDTASYVSATEGAAVNLRNGQYLGAAAGDTLVSIEALRGTRFDDSLIMGDGDNRIIGAGGDDFLDGGNGNDILIGGAGGDFMHGGNGIDTVVYRASGAGINVSLTTAINTGGHAQGDTFSWIHNIRGSNFADRIEGDILQNQLRGNDGDDTLIGRGGRDVLTGGEGADSFVFVDPGDHVSATQATSAALASYDGNTADRIIDFTVGTDRLEFASAAFAGSVFNTDDIGALGLASATDTAFAFSDMTLYYVSFAGPADFLAGTATVLQLARLVDVLSLGNDDLAFV